MGNSWSGVPSREQVQNAPKHIAWEYVALLAAAQQMAVSHEPPINHLVGVAFLVHLRNLAEFFYKGAADFRKNAATLPSRRQDNIYAVDLCSLVLWDEAPFNARTLLGFSEISIAFDGQFHLHGTVTLIRRTWDAFLQSLRPEYQKDLSDWLAKHAGGMQLSLIRFDHEFEKMARRCHWRFNQTPDGPV